MIGLLKKDSLLLKGQLLSWGLLVIMTIFLIKFLDKLGVEISVGLTLVTLCMEVLNTLTSDQANHGLVFLMTLPVTKKQYVNEKYMLLLGSSMFTTIVMITIANICLQVFKMPEKFTIIFSMSYVTEILLALMFGLLISYQLKYGPEKAQRFMSMLGAVIAVVGGSVIYLIRTIKFAGQWYQQLRGFFIEHGYWSFLLVLTFIFIGSFSFIWRHSVKQFEKQEF